MKDVFGKHGDKNCPVCGEDRETSCRCGWTPGLCIICGDEEAKSAQACGPCSRQYPTLLKLLNSGDVFRDKGAYIGKTADGHEVQVGNEPEDTEKYLKHRPTPDSW